jgi:hypothetical protein
MLPGAPRRGAPAPAPARARTRLTAAFFSRAVALALVLLLLEALRRALQRAPPLHVIVAYESIPRQYDGAERFLAAFVRALAALPNVRVTFAFRAAAGGCAASAADAAALGGAAVARVEAAPDSPAFAALLRAAPRTALLLPLSFFASCAGANASASAEAYGAAARAACARGDGAACRAAVGVFAFDAQAARLEGVAAHEPDARQAARYAAAARAARAREAALYGAADVLAMLTPEDLAAAPPARAGAPRLVVHFRDAVEPALAAAAGGAPAARAARAARARPGWAARDGFFFVGGGDSPTNHLALHAFLTAAWPRVRAALPGATLHVVGAPPAALCAARGLWCGWLAHSPFAAAPPAAAGIIVHGRVDDVDAIAARARVAIAPLVCGTGVNTKTGFSLARGLPVVATPKGARGYGGAPSAGLVVAPLDALADAALRLHEDEAAWGVASAAALELTARLDDERAPAADIAALVAALGAAADARGA